MDKVQEKRFKQELRDGEIDTGIGIQVIVDELVGEAQDDLDKLRDIQNTLQAGKELDSTQQAFLAWYQGFIKG